MSEWETYEPNWEECPYCECTYEEWDTGYKEFGCSYYGDVNNMDCNGGELYGCPLAFKYKVEEQNECK